MGSSPMGSAQSVEEEAGFGRRGWALALGLAGRSKREAGRGKRRGVVFCRSKQRKQGCDGFRRCRRGNRAMQGSGSVKPPGSARRGGRLGAGELVPERLQMARRRSLLQGRPW